MSNIIDRVTGKITYHFRTGEDNFTYYTNDEDCTFDVPAAKANRAIRRANTARRSWSRRGVERRASAQKRYLSRVSPRATRTTDLSWELAQYDSSDEPVRAYRCDTCYLVREGEGPTCNLCPSPTLDDYPDYDVDDRYEGEIHWYVGFTATPDGKTIKTEDWAKQWTNSCVCCGKLGIARPDHNIPDHWTMIQVRDMEPGFTYPACPDCAVDPRCRGLVSRESFDRCNRYRPDPVYVAWLAKVEAERCREHPALKSAS